MKKFLRVVALLAFLVAGLPASAQKTALTVGYIGTADLMPLIVAKEKGFFDKRNLDVTPSRIQLASNIPSAVMAGTLQIGMGTGPILLQVTDSGLDFVAVGGIARMTKDNAVASLVVRTPLKVGSPAELRGKKIGVPGFNSMFHVVFQKWLLDRGLQPKDVTMIEAVFPQMGDLLKSGMLDAVLVIEPFRGRLVGSGVGYKLSDFIAEVNDNIIAAYWMAKRDWAAANGPAIRAFREAYAEAIGWTLKNRAEVQAMEAKLLGVPSPVVPYYTAEVSAADFEPYARMGRELKMFRNPIDVNKLVWK